ncbi:MAG: DUF1735 domain-containing protein [Bacteroidales bacterium]
MNKKRLLTYLLAPLLLASCDRDFVERVPELISAGESGIQSVLIIDLENKGSLPLSIARGGLDFKDSQFEYVIDNHLIDSINEVSRTSYKVLPPNCYELKLYKREIKDDTSSYLEVGEIIYDPIEISKISDINDAEYTIPVRLKSNNISVNPNRESCIYKFEFSTESR